MSAPRGSILLVDDEEKILKTLGRALREERHEVIATSNAEDARRLLAERNFDVLLVDDIHAQLLLVLLFQIRVAQRQERRRDQSASSLVQPTIGIGFGISTDAGRWRRRCRGRSSRCTGSPTR